MRNSTQVPGSAIFQKPISKYSLETTFCIQRGGSNHPTRSGRIMNEMTEEGDTQTNFEGYEILHRF